MNAAGERQMLLQKDGPAVRSGLLSRKALRYSWSCTLTGVGGKLSVRDTERNLLSAL